MSSLSDTAVRHALESYVDPVIGRSLVEADVLKAVAVRDGRALIDIELGFPCEGYRKDLELAVASHVGAALGVDVGVRVTWTIGTHAVQAKLQPLPNIKNVIAVASGKGGVGKSTVAVNLALALQAEGAKVGILDADIYGPSQPRMLGTSEKPKSPDGKSMHPIEALGLQAMSIGFLIDEEQPMIWRGPMATQALMQLLNETQWRELDYLVIDLPPGTGDIQLTLSQRIPVSGALVVTTPQDIALIDAKKGLQMFRKVEVPILGLIENMSFFCCPNCGHRSEIFGSGGGERMSAQFGVDLLGRVPLDPRIREQADGGKPTVAAEPDSELAGIYRDIARRAAARLAHGEPERAFPEIQVSDD
ncbi:MAG: ATPase [Panacagrimonas sp.]|jgi:ATP-binding protein involved in chromosome partitioning|nr:iron-sulfur cluster carrier protein ApbC [Panacagrimonas sp.]MCC2657038.1 ATPase [Panacagrimonas sp.]